MGRVISLAFKITLKPEQRANRMRDLMKQETRRRSIAVKQYSLQNIPATGRFQVLRLRLNFEVAFANTVRHCVGQMPAMPRADHLLKHVCAVEAHKVIVPADSFLREGYGGARTEYPRAE
jgi:hypothetical protein